MEPLFRRALDGAVAEVADYLSQVDGRWYRIQVAPVNDRRGATTAGLLIAQDVTEVRRAAAELGVLRHRFETAFINAPAGMALVRPDGQMMELNQHLAQIMGRSREELVETDVFEFIHPDDEELARQVWDEVVEVPGQNRSQERRYVHPDGSHVWVHANQVLVADAAGGAEHVVMQCQDVTARRNAEVDLRRLALLDPLTGLGNRTLMHDRLAHALDRTRRRPAGMAVVYLDLDRFKVINDSLGHDVGDEVLTAVAGRLQSALRPQDTIARLGGDEFAVLCEDIGGEDQAREIAERLAAAASGPLQLRRPGTLPSLEAVTVEASVGVVVASTDHERPVDLLRDADLAMYSAKAGGRGRVVMHSKDMRANATRRQQLETALRAAVEAEEIDVAYQPILRLDDGAVVGLEALARWTDPVHGSVSHRLAGTGRATSATSRARPITAASVPTARMAGSGSVSSGTWIASTTANNTSAPPTRTARISP
jgi:diguanylate cyclase (GGDEF)-like protein/PAS domain S-box-containing protein